jgi:phage gp45-like
MFVAQKSLEKNLYRPFKRLESYSSIDVGTVVSVNYEDDTVEITTDIGQELNHVPIMSNKIVDDFDDATNLHNGDNSILLDLPLVGSRVIIAYLYGKLTHPIVLGCTIDVTKHEHTRVSTSVADQGAKVYLHQSHYWDKVNNTGNFEQYFPDGSTISVSDTVIENTSKLSSEETLQPASPVGAKTIRIKHSTGTVIKIQADGTVEITAGNPVIVNATEVDLNADTVHLGLNAADSLILGSKLMDKFNHHIHPTGVGPSAEPISLYQLGSSDFSQITKIK